MNEGDSQPKWRQWAERFGAWYARQAHRWVAWRRLFIGGVGLTYLIAFASIWLQVHGLIGPDGILPADAYLDAAREHLGSGAYWQLPTLSWLVGASGPALDLICGLGLVMAFALTAGFIPLPAAVGCWLCYLSIYTNGQIFLSFQWDLLLLESGFLTLFIVPPRVIRRGEPGWYVPPRPTALFLIRWLLFRLIFSSAVVKLAGGDETWTHLLALTFHFETQPLPTWSSWLLHQAPAIFQKWATFLTLFVELVVPFGLFGPRPVRVVSGAAIIGFMLTIAATGNFGFFNLLTIVLCFSAFDDTQLPRTIYEGLCKRGESISSDEAPPRAHPWPTWLVRWPAGLLVAVSLVPLIGAFRTGVQPPLLSQLYRRQAPFHIVSPYGLFARMTTERPEIIVEGSVDGRQWRSYGFRWKPGLPSKRPKFCSPHMPRLDWQLWFAALGSLRQNVWIGGLLKGLLEGRPEVLELMGRNPFRREPPRYVRARLYRYRFTTVDEFVATGKWWKREELGAYTPEITLDPSGGLVLARLRGGW